MESHAAEEVPVAPLRLVASVIQMIQMNIVKCSMNHLPQTVQTTQNKAGSFLSFLL